MKLKMKNQYGFTIIELLATLTILFIISTLIYQVFITTIKSTDRLESQHLLRNELIVVVQKFNLFMENIDLIEIAGKEDDVIVSLKAIDKSIMQNEAGVIEETSTEHLIEKKDDDLFIDHVKINSDAISLANTRFYLKSGGFEVKFHAKFKNDAAKPLDIFVFYKLDGDS